MKRFMKWKWMLPVVAAVLGLVMSTLAMVATFTGTASASRQDGAASASQATEADALGSDMSGGCNGDCTACPLACGGVLAPAVQTLPGS